MQLFNLLVLCASCAIAARRASPYAHLSRSPRQPETLFRLAKRAAQPPARSSSTYCVPGQPCWPSSAAWNAFNSSIGGALLAVAPPLAPCFGFNSHAPDAAECNAVVANFSNSYFRASLPGAMQDIASEKNWTTGAGCFTADTPCELGNIPPFAVAATTPAIVSAALNFANTHGIRVAIKSSGHEYQGRSTAPDALLIWTHALVGAAFEPAFSTCAASQPQAAITTHPGTSWGEVYALADANRVEVVGGSEISVSSCGGYTQGGGHSWMGPAHGMAVDNVLRFEAVLANGTSLTASACENEDLFWALRGGGGGTFAVVTSCTYAAHPFSPSGAAGLFATIYLIQGATSLTVFLDGFFSYAHTLSNSSESGGVVAGGYFVMPDFESSTVSLFLGFNGTTAQATAALQPLSSWINSPAIAQYLSLANSTEIVAFPSLMAFHEAFDSHSEPTGGISTLGSRLIPAAIMRDDMARVAVAMNITVITEILGGFTGLFVCGGAVASSDPDGTFTSISPSWRAAGAHVVFGAGWPANASSSDVQAVLDGINALNGDLRAATPGSGAYWSESDFEEDAWQESFWGGNYARLQSIKRRVDPLGVFACHHCVEN